MKQGARIQAVIDILERIEKSPIPMDNVLRDYMHHKRYIGSKDRAAIVECVYGVMRSTARLGWWLGDLKAEDTPRHRVIAYLYLAEEKNKFLLDQIFDGEGYGPSVLNASEDKMIEALEGQTLDSDKMDAVTRSECPPWAAEKLQALYGENFEQELAAMLIPASLDLRVNTLKTDIDGAQKSLKKDDVVTHKTRYSPVCLRVEGKAYMSATKAFHAGLVEIQDEGSQLIAQVCGAAPGMRVLDFCAGGGGKTLALAAKMEGKGIIIAMDNDARRLEKGKRRYKKAGVHNVEMRCLEDEKHRKWLRRQKGTMDVVLVDAPCSSSGTWRRNPDLRWNQYGPSLDEIKVMQAEILERVAEKTKVGGRLVYATCSLFAEENEDQVDNFLKNHPEYKVIPLKDIWEDERGECPQSNPYLRLSPYQSDTDGFFAAILERTI